MVAKLPWLQLSRVKQLDLWCCATRAESICLRTEGCAGVSLLPITRSNTVCPLGLAFGLLTRALGLTRCALAVLFQDARWDMFFPTACALRLAFGLLTQTLGLTNCAIVILLQEARPDMFFRTACALRLAFGLLTQTLGSTRCTIVILLQEARSIMFFRTACTLCFVFRNAYLNHEKLHFAAACAGNFASSKEVWKILPSYEELRRGAIGRGKEVEVMSIRCHVK